MRARNLKPSIFKNEYLATSDPLFTLIFEGLWCLADREGRLEDRPRKIHLEINAGRPYEGTEAALAFLAEHGFIVRYEVDGEKYIEIPKFREHQRPHSNEAESKIPPRSEVLSTKVQSTLHQCEQDFALNPSSLNPECSSPKNTRERASDRFDEFWALYPRRVGKAAAKRAWSRKGLNAKADEILEHLRARVRSDAQWLAEGGKFIPHPQTWLNRDGWLDEYQVGSTNGAGEQSRKPSAVERAQRATGGGF